MHGLQGAVLGNDLIVGQLRSAWSSFFVQRRRCLQLTHESSSLISVRASFARDGLVREACANAACSRTHARQRFAYGVLGESPAMPPGSAGPACSRQQRAWPASSVIVRLRRTTTSERSALECRDRGARVPPLSPEESNSSSNDASFVTAASTPRPVAYDLHVGTRATEGDAAIESVIATGCCLHTQRGGRRVSPRRRPIALRHLETGPLAQTAPVCHRH